MMDYLLQKIVSKNKRFKTKAIVTTIAWAILPICLVAIFIHQLLDNRINDYTEQFGKNMAASLQSSLSEDFAYVDYKNITQKLIKVRKHSDITSIVAKDSYGEVLFSTKDVPEHNKEDKITFNVEMKSPEGLKTGDIIFSIPVNTSDHRDIFVLTIISVLFCIGSIVIIISSSMKKLLRPYEKIYKNMSLLAKGEYTPFTDYLHKNDEREILNEDYNQIVNTLQETQKQLIKASKKEAIVKVASQVSHDIRSPLAVLNMMISKKLDCIDEEDRIIIRNQINRIQDIANQLVYKGKESKQNTPAPSDVIRAELLSSAIENIITEKRIYFRSSLGVTIEGEIYDNKSYGLFSDINLSEFKRLLSNIINNAVEAFENNEGKVLVQLQSVINEDKSFVQIKIIDNGKGIPSHIISQLGTKQLSFGKESSNESGSGLGLFHAKSKVQEWKGTLEICSTLGKGTTITITLPKVSPPSWFVPALPLVPKQAIAILDDDQGIHLTWNQRFKECHIDQHDITIVHHSTPSSFEQWYIENKEKYETILTLSDYELIGFKESGLDILEKLKMRNAALVTSYYENENIRKRCSDLGIKLIPKMLAGFVPIEVTVHQKDLYESVYIDDEKLLRTLWEKRAVQVGVKLLTLSKAQDFYQFEHLCSKETTRIYLDSDLGEGQMKGEDLALELHNLGYKNLFIASGYEASRFAHLPMVTLVEKNYPYTIETKF